MMTNGLPCLVKHEINLNYSYASQVFYNLSKLAVTCNFPNNEIISQSPPLCCINWVKYEI